MDHKNCKDISLTKTEVTSLREKAETQLAENFQGQDSDKVSPENIHMILHELYVHQIELEMQNEELRNAQLLIEKIGRAILISMTWRRLAIALLMNKA